MFLFIQLTELINCPPLTLSAQYKQHVLAVLVNMSVT